LRLGEEIGSGLQGGELILLRGDIGAGKTVLARGILQGLGSARFRGSPTFTLVHEYDTQPAAYHVDLYRLSDAGIEDVGLSDYLEPSSIMIVEWPERAAGYVRALAIGGTVEVDLEITGPEERVIHIVRSPVQQVGVPRKAEP
jgi:tRNA threonylcarbamoyladenosine biosynthesis protein TsaE